MRGCAWRWLLAVAALVCGLLPLPAAARAAAAREGEGSSEGHLRFCTQKGALAAASTLGPRLPAARRKPLRAPCAADILLKFKAAINNWEEVYASRDMSGWQAGAGLSVCLWSGVDCDPVSGPGNRVTSL